MEDRRAEARFELDLPAGTLRWSSAMQHLYEYRDTSPAVSLALLASHKHPADLPRMHRLVRRAETRLEPYVYEHRIITAADTVKTIIVSAVPSKVEAGRAVAISGVAIDLAAVRRGGSFVVEPSVDSLRDDVAGLREALTARDVIGQAKGILMERHKISDTDAFGLLNLTSQRTNCKVRDVAERLATTGELYLG